MTQGQADPDLRRAEEDRKGTIHVPHKGGEEKKDTG